MRLGRLEVSCGFLLTIAWLNYLDRQCLVPMALLACALHELGHFAAIRCLGGDIGRVRLTAIGAEMELSRPLFGWREGAAALAGPAVNLILALLACRRVEGTVFAGLNLALACFNLLPVGSLDGGRALRCLLAALAGEDAARRAGERLDLCFTALALALGAVLAVKGGNITLLLAAVWMAGCLRREKRRQMGVAIFGRNG